MIIDAGGVNEDEALLTDDDGALIRAWLHGFGANTVRSYRIDILEFFEFVQKSITQIGTQEIRAYLKIVAETRTPAVQRRIVTAIKSLFHYANETGYMDYDPAATLRNSTPEPPRNPVSLSEAKVMRLLNNAGNERDYAIIALAYYGALRGPELVGLLWGDILGNRLRVRTPPAQRIVILPPHLVVRLAKLRGDRRLNMPLLASRNGGGPITVRSIDRVVQNIGKQLGETIGGLSILRNTHACHALARGASLTDVQAALGHSTPRSTIRHANIMKTGRANTASILPM